jgi:hypothetical protein
MKYYGMRIDYSHDMEFARIYLESFCDEIMLKHSVKGQAGRSMANLIFRMSSVKCSWTGDS